MTPDQNHDHTPPLPDHLQRSLRGLQRDIPPARDLWPGIQARIGQAPSVEPAPAPATAPQRVHGGRRHRRPRRLAALATAASLAAVLAIAWTLAPPPASAPRQDVGTGLVVAATHMTREYRAAWRAFDAQRPAGVDASALREIDRNAAQVRKALRQDPDAQYLFERLQSLYALRLDLSRRLSTLPA